LRRIQLALCGAAEAERDVTSRPSSTRRLFGVSVGDSKPFVRSLFRCIQAPRLYR
jgi:hypothetical protein